MEEPRLKDLARKIEAVLQITPTTQQMLSIDALVILPFRLLKMRHDNPPPRASDRELFLSQMKTHLDHLLSKLNHAKQGLVADFEYFIRTYQVSDVLGHDRDPHQCFKSLLEELKNLSTSVDLWLHHARSMKKKGPQTDHDLSWLIQELAAQYKAITGKEAKRSYDEYQGMDTGRFLSFVEVVLDHYSNQYGVEIDLSLPYLVRKTITS